MSKQPIDDGGPAFPRTGNFDPESDFREHPNPDTEPQGGMSLRDWFAGMALSSMAASEDTPDGVIVIKAYRIAIAMIVEKRRRENPPDEQA